MLIASIFFRISRSTNQVNTRVSTTLYTKLTGLAYTEYLQLLRLRRAETLLLTTDATIDQITEAVGYHNKGYFYKIFTERHQLTPAQFRKKM